MRVIEDVQLSRHATRHSGLVPQGSQDRLGKCFALMQEGAGQHPHPVDVGTFVFHQHNRQFVPYHRKNRCIDSDIWSWIRG